MSYVHAFAIVWALVVALDYATYQVRPAPKMSFLCVWLWVLGLVCVVFELGYWFFH